jgi:hypothetical protein
LNERIDNLRYSLEQERDIREEIIKKYEEEQKANSLASVDGIELRTRNQDYELQISNLEARIKA